VPTAGLSVTVLPNAAPEVVEISKLAGAVKTISAVKLKPCIVNVVS